MKNYVVMAAVALMSLVVLESTASAQIFGRRTVCRTRTVSCVKNDSCCEKACVRSSCETGCGAALLHVPGRVVHAVGNAVHNVLTPDCVNGSCTIRRVERTVVRGKVVAPAPTTAPAPAAPAEPKKVLESLPPQQGIPGPNPNLIESPKNNLLYNEGVNNQFTNR